MLLIFPVWNKTNVAPTRTGEWKEELLYCEYFFYCRNARHARILCIFSLKMGSYWVFFNDSCFLFLPHFSFSFCFSLFVCFKWNCWILVFELSILFNFLIRLTKTAALEYANKNIRVNALCPATTQTPMVERFQQKWPEWQEKTNQSYPLGRIGTPDGIIFVLFWRKSLKCSLFEEIKCLVFNSCFSLFDINISTGTQEMAEAVVWMCSDACTWMTGHTLVIDGGQSC